MTSNVHLANFDVERTDELVKMWRDSFESAVIADPHPLVEQRDYLLSNVVPNNEIRLALLRGRIVGFVAATTTSIAQLYVEVESQRQGIGTMMLNWAKSQSEGSLWLYTFECNRTAQSFYEQHGFEIVERGFEESWQLADIKYQWSKL